MARNEDEEKDMEIPGDGDENVGDESPQKRREKRKKSKEERIAERRVIFWTLLIILLVTLGFWMAPKIENLLQGGSIEIGTDNNKSTLPKVEQPVRGNYKEITL